MKVLIVGAGALGQVFGHHLSRGGAQVDVLVRAGREEAARAGATLWRVRCVGAPIETRFEPVRAFGDVGATRGESWDLVLLCVASTELRGEFLARLAAAVGTATVASIGQAALDAEALARAFPAEQLVAIVPSLFAWSAPLATETPGPGTAYWIPPLASLAVGGTAERARPVVAALRRGGLSASVSRDAFADGARTAARTMPYVAALGLAGWSLSALRAGPLLALAAAASREALAAVEGRRDVPARDDGAGSLTLTRLVLRVLARVVPFPLERYLAVHFTKVSAQTRQMLREWASIARERRLHSASLESLQAAMESPPEPRSERLQPTA
jgi:ketopantoate reductase